MTAVEAASGRALGKRGRDSENNVPFVGAVQTTDDGLPHLACLSPRLFTYQSMKDYLAGHTAVLLTALERAPRRPECGIRVAEVHRRSGIAKRWPAAACPRRACVTKRRGSVGCRWRNTLVGRCDGGDFPR